MKAAYRPIIAILFVLVLGLSSCQKGDSGAVGPQGPAGPQGTAGPKALSIDIIATFSASSSAYSYSSYANLDSSAILVYFKDQANNNSLVQTPFLWYNGTSSAVAYLWATVEKSTCKCNDLIKIYAQKPNNSQNTSAFTTSTTLAFKIVEIKSAYSNMRLELPDDLSYENIRKVYNIKD